MTLAGGIKWFDGKCGELEQGKGEEIMKLYQYDGEVLIG